VDVATTVVNQDIWLVLAQAQLVPPPSQVLAVVLVLLEVVLEVVLPLVVDLLVGLAPLLAISAVAQTTLLEIVKLRP